MTYGYENLKLEKGMYAQSGKSFSRVLESLDPSENYRGTAMEGLDAFQRQLKRFDIHVKGAGSDMVEKFFHTSESSVLFPEFVSRVVRQGMEQAAVDLNAELRFLTPAGDSAAEQTELLSREAETGTDAVVLIPADREALAEAASGLSGDEEQICRALTAAAEHLRRSLEAERAAGPEREKRTAALWLSGGALLVILLI